MEIEEKNLLVAACHDDKLFIEEYLVYNESELCDVILARVLHKATEHCSVKVVETLVNSPHGMLCQLGSLAVH